ncbi:MAG: ABC transporter ATP-binding protein [Magnetococcales bacterium]|nr:ABC transporter ATP-binding protein [Magnetococcales bacterium]
MTAALTVSHLNKRYDNDFHALKDVDLTIEPGELFAILGPNGAGKSTLINIIAQVIRKSSGSVQVFGFDVDKQTQLAKMALGLTPQDIAVDPFFSVREVLHNHSGYFGIRNNDAWVDFLLDRLELTEQAEKITRQLSGGMKRRLTIAKALVHKPKLLILDEPTAGVDVSLRHTLWKFVRELHGNGMTIILTTHYLEEAQDLAQRVAILQDGAIIACDQTQNLLTNFGERRFEMVLESETASIQMPEGIEMINKGGRLSGSFNAEQSERFFVWFSTIGSAVRDVKIEPARLEDVFLKLTNGAER